MFAAPGFCGQALLAKVAPRARSLTAPILRTDESDIFRPFGTVTYPLFQDLEPSVPDLVRRGRHADRVGRVESKCANEEAILRITRTNDGRLPPTGHGVFACFKIQTGVVTGVLAVVALKALAFDDGPDVAGEVNFLGDAARIEAVVRIVVRTGLTGGAVGEENGSKESQGDDNQEARAHTKTMLRDRGNASLVASCAYFVRNSNYQRGSLLSPGHVQMDGK